MPKRRLVQLLIGAAMVVITMRAADAETPSTQPAVRVPESRGGADLVGKPMPQASARWLRTDGNRPLRAAGSVTLYRWWTDTCPYCAASLPAIESLRQKYGPKGLQVVAVYHPKPPRDMKDQTLLDAADAIGYAGPIAVDRDWSVLRSLYLSTGPRGATSASFLVDRTGVIRFVHPGPDFFPSVKPEDAREDADYRAVEQAIVALLAEPNASPPTSGPAPAKPGARD